MGDISMEAVVLYDYTAQEPDELTLKEGDIISKVQVRDGGWWEGTNKDGNRGLFPDNFVKMISDKATSCSSGTILRGKKFLVKFNYIPVNVDELELSVGDVVELISEIEEGWWEGKLNNKIGVFPSNFVTEILETDATKTSQENSYKIITSHNEISQDTEKMEVDESRTSTKVPATNDAPVLPPKPKPVTEMCIALFPYEAKHDDELTLKENDKIVLLSTDLPDKGWWKGQLNGKIGVFPDNFVKLITVNDEVSKPQRPSVTKSTTNKTRDNMNSKPITNSNVAALRKSLEIPNDYYTNPSKKPVVSKKPEFSPSNSSDATKTSFVTSSPLEKVSSSPERSFSTSKNSFSSDTSSLYKSIETDGKSWTETSVDSCKTRPASAVMNDKLKAELENSLMGKETDNPDGSTGSKISRANSSEKHSLNNGVEMLSESKEIDLNVVERSEVLTHPTASRAKAPKRRPPSGINFKEDDVPVANNKIHSSSITINGKVDMKAAPWLQELKMSQIKKNTSQVNIRSGFTGTGSNVTFRLQRPVSMFSGDAETHHLPMQPKSLPPSHENPAVSDVTTTNITPTVISSSSEKVVTVSVSDWSALLEKVSTLEIRLEKQNEEFKKTMLELNSKLADEVSLRLAAKNETDKLTDLVTELRSKLADEVSLRLDMKNEIDKLMELATQV